jgi:flagellar motor switch protein FliM
LSFDLTVAECQGNLNLVFPAVVSNALLRKLGESQVRTRLRNRSIAEQTLRGRLLLCPFRLELGMRIPGMALRDLMSLSPGALLPLKCPAYQAAVLRVGDLELFGATIARRGWVRAAQVVGRMRRPKRESVL